MAQGLDLSRFIQVFIVQGVAGLFYLFIGYKIIKRDRKGTNIILSTYYFLIAIGAILNIIYVNIFNETIALVLHFTTYYLFCLSLIFLLLFVLILFKSEEIITFNKQVTIFTIFALLLIVLWFIPGGIKLNEVSWKPEWSWSFFIYSIVICSSIAIGPTIYISFKIYRSFQKDVLKKKWIFFLVGIFGYFYLYYGTSLSNSLADPTIRLIWSIISLPTLITIYFIYYGVAKQL
ncbi:MAG: hypothetical protein KGD73_07580 [Candidatus Lokiarchaeota archaeon]|nr:hypothetical protein [Candidatus Lokiarchaeota archaeon]